MPSEPFTGWAREPLASFARKVSKVVETLDGLCESGQQDPEKTPIGS